MITYDTAKLNHLQYPGLQSQKDIYVQIIEFYTLLEGKYFQHTVISWIYC